MSGADLDGAPAIRRSRRVPLESGLRQLAGSATRPAKATIFPRVCRNSNNPPRIKPAKQDR